LQQKLNEMVLKAKQVVSDQCVNGRWQMCVPPQKDDSDMVLVNTLDALVAEVNRLEANQIDLEAIPPNGRAAHIAQDLAKDGLTSKKALEIGAVIDEKIGRVKDLEAVLAELLTAAKRSIEEGESIDLLPALRGNAVLSGAKFSPLIGPTLSFYNRPPKVSAVEAVEAASILAEAGHPIAEAVEILNNEMPRD
jgi:hypothetical protein